MDRFRNILVGVNLADGDLCLSHEFSAATRSAVNKALWLAEHTGARITFLGSLLPCLGDVRETRNLAEMERLQVVVDTIHERARTRMAGLVAEARSHGIEANEVRTDGPAWLKLIEAVVTNGHDLVLVGSHHQHALGRLLLGSTGRRLIRKCPCPVWVTSPIEEGRVGTILAPTDFSETADKSLRIAWSLAEKCEADLHILHAVPAGLEPVLREIPIPEDDVDGFRAKLFAEAHREFDDMLSRTGLNEKVDQKHCHIVTGPPHGVIEAVAKQHHADLVVMATQARSGLSGILMGNTAESVLANLTCSILAIKPAGFRCPIDFDAVCVADA